MRSILGNAHNAESRTCAAIKKIICRTHHAAGMIRNDPGGYFVVNGTERVLVTQEDLAPNRIMIEDASRSSSATHIAKVFSTTQGFRRPRDHRAVRKTVPSACPSICAWEDPARRC